MHLLAAEGGTWGISGPAFAGGYLVAMVVSLIGTLLIRRWIRRGRRLRRELHAYEVAYLIGGPRRTIATAVAGLRADGAIETSGDRDQNLRAIGGPRTMRTQLDTAIHSTLRAGRVTTARMLGTGYDVRRAVDKIRDGLVRDGLAVGPRQRLRSRLAVALLVGLLGVGVVRLVAGIRNDRPVGQLTSMLMVLTVVTVILLLRTPRSLRSGTAAVEAVRSRNAHLDPSMSPAWTTYGAPGAALGVALFGMAALTSIDPEFAAAAGLQHQLVSAAGAAGGASSGSFGYSCSAGVAGGGSSCGGGGCGGGGCGG
jgi:uncharacterized protein (TIGR04222 family)